jgi:hypothetical protein
MQRLEVSGAVRPIYGSLGVKRLMNSAIICTFCHVLRWCGAEDETSAHNLCECESSASLRHVYLGSFLLKSEGMKSIIFGGPTGTVVKEQGIHKLT